MLYLRINNPTSDQLCQNCQLKQYSEQFIKTNTLNLTPHKRNSGASAGVITSILTGKP